MLLANQTNELTFVDCSAILGRMPQRSGVRTWNRSRLSLFARFWVDEEGRAGRVFLAEQFDSLDVVHLRAIVTTLQSDPQLDVVFLADRWKWFK